MSDNPYESSKEYGADKSFTPPVGSTAARPNSVIVFGVLNLAFGAWGILSSALNVVSIVFGGANIANWLFVMMFMLNLLKSIVLIVAGIGLLRWRPIGRTASIIYGWGAIAVAVMIGVVQAMFFQQSMNVPSQFATMIAITLSTLVFSLPYPILLLVFMYSRNVTLALRGHTVGLPSHDERKGDAREPIPFRR